MTLFSGKAGLLLTALATSLGSHRAAADPNALWDIVGGQCVPDERQFDVPAPCVQVDLTGGYAVLKDIKGNTQFLLIPTTRITGIENPALLAPGAPNYWNDAWQARHFVEQRARHPLPRDAIGLAINSIHARSQNQLHIHIDCMRLDVVAALREHASAIGPQWSQFPLALVGHPYMAMRLTEEDLGSANPFVLLADGIPKVRADMANYTMVVVGADPGFVLLAGHATPATGNWGAGEQLLDHACAAATVAAR